MSVTASPHPHSLGFAKFSQIQFHFRLLLVGMAESDQLTALLPLTTLLPLEPGTALQQVRQRGLVGHRCPPTDPFAESHLAAAQRPSGSLLSHLSLIKLITLAKPRWLP